MSFGIPGLCGPGLNFIWDGFRSTYVIIACFMWLMASLLTPEYMKHHGHKGRFWTFLALTFLATVGVFLSADLYTTFIFFEIMSFTSYVWVAQEETEEALRAASTYLAVAVTGGLVMLMGLFLLNHELGTLEISALGDAVRNYLGGASMADLSAAAAGGELAASAAGASAAAGGNPAVLYAAGLCLLFGFGAKAGAFPLHIWLPKAHPVAPAPASALLSGILTKTGVCGIISVSMGLFRYDPRWGSLILTLGVITMVLGAVLALFSVNLKRTLACSSMSQIGFILVGVGMAELLGEENALAVHGSILHMVNHSLIKTVLFLAAGAIYMNTHSLDLNVLRGYGRRKPLLKLAFLVGACSIAGVPGFSGYVSKTLLHEAIVEYQHAGGPVFLLVEWLFLISGGMTLGYMTKLFVCIFVEKNENPRVQAKYDTPLSTMNRASRLAVYGSAAVLFLWGTLPAKLPAAEHGAEAVLHWSFTPGSFMDLAAERAQDFFLLEEFGHRVHYFSLTNLKGSLISIAIGAAIYLFFIRRFLMRQRRYVNLWPAGLDLEDLVYRPLLLKVLPGVFGGACLFLYNISDWVAEHAVRTFAVTVRILEPTVDYTVVKARKTIYRDSVVKEKRLMGSWFTETLGTLLNRLLDLWDAARGRKGTRDKDYVRILALRHEEIRENNRLIERSLSYGMMIAGIGLLLALAYSIVLK